MKRHLLEAVCGAAFLLGLSVPQARCQTGQAGEYQGPVGVTGMFTAITTAGSYDPAFHSARREIDDIVVPGAVGKYPLKMTRYLNTRGDYSEPNGMGPSWTHEYSWTAWINGSSATPSISEPNGTVYNYLCVPPVGISEQWMPGSVTTNPDGSLNSGKWRLADGGTVVFTMSGATSRATSIVDPYGVTTTIAYTTINNVTVVSQVTEQAGRHLNFIYGDSDANHGNA
ncbi:MAG: hypothetical protein JO354_00905, partial [Verrucomicrobia bacterium]|nr:hypothetical protein [Verrucomicrobiota bacterium]